jgi:hypothetical protein
MGQETCTALEDADVVSVTACGSPDADTLCIINDQVIAFRVQPLVSQSQFVI